MMKWTLANDRTSPVITAERHIHSPHGSASEIILPNTCVIFEMGKAMSYLKTHYDTTVLVERLPCFIADSACISLKGNENLCFVHGGYGAPAAVDLLETILALGVQQVIVAGMCGGFGVNIQVGDVVIPQRILCEEGTSHHYYEEIEYAVADQSLFNHAVSGFADKFTVISADTVTTDSFYRQTYAKEAYWREKGCVGVDLESSALLAVGRYYSIPAVSILLCSDKHPLSETQAGWTWGNADFSATRQDYIRQVVQFALSV